MLYIFRYIAYIKRNMSYIFRFMSYISRIMSYIFRYMSYIFRKLPNCRKKLPKSLKLKSILHKKYCLQQRFVTIARLGLCLNFLRKFIRSFVLVKLSAKFTQLPQAVKRCALWLEDSFSKQLLLYFKPKLNKNSYSNSGKFPLFFF